MSNLKPNLLHICITDNGGAGKAAFNVYTQLKDLGYPSQFITLVKNRNKTEISEITTLDKTARKIKRFFFKKRLNNDSNYQMYGIDEHYSYTSTRSITKLVKRKPQFIFVYWISGFLNAKNLYELHKHYDATIVLSLTDMVSFTGGCHFSLGCTRYSDACGKCPGLYSTDLEDLSRKIVLFKKEFYDTTKMAIIVGTKTLKKQVENSFLLKDKKNYLIRYHVDCNIFSKKNKVQLRKKYNLNKDKKIIFFGATHIQQERKGFFYLKKSLEALKNKLNKKEISNIILLVAGNGYENFCKSLPFEYHGLGFINGDQDLSEIYALSDIYLNTSIDDIGPFMLVEAMLSYCLVVSYNVGLANDLVVDNETGFIAQNKNTNAYADKIYKALGLLDNEKEKILISARKKSLELHKWEKQPNQYKQIFIDFSEKS